MQWSVDSGLENSLPACKKLMSSVWNTWTQVLKCSIKWDVLTFCFSPVSASLLHSFYIKTFPWPWHFHMVWCWSSKLGCHDGESKFAGTTFSPPELWHGTSSSTLRKMWGLLHSLESFLDIIRHKSVQIFTDNSNVVRVMGQGSTDLRLNDIVLRIISLTMEHDITLLPTWVPRDQNKVADGLTHLEDPCDWTLIADVFQKIVAQWGLPTIDRFASHSNHLLDRCNSMLRCPGSVGINALAQRDWSEHFNWCFPPFNLIPSVISIVTFLWRAIQKSSLVSWHLYNNSLFPASAKPVHPTQPPNCNVYMVCFSGFLRDDCACQIFADEVRFYSSHMEIFLAKRKNDQFCSGSVVCIARGKSLSCPVKGYKGYKDGLQPESLADGNWLVKQNQPVSKIETKSDTNLRSLYESCFRNVLISKSVILWWQVKKGINLELEGANTRRVLNIPSKRSL